MNLKKLILLGSLLVAATCAIGQGQGRGMRGGMNSPLMLLNRDDVKTDLALTDDQKTKLAELRDGMRSQMQEARQAAGDDQDAMRKAMADVMKKATDQVNAILTADQQKRLKEIRLQLSGYSAVGTDKDLQSSLGLTDDQKSKIADLAKQAADANQAIGQKMQNQEIQREEAMAGFKKNQDALNSGIEAILTADQRNKFKDMQGKAFVATSQPAGFGGRGN